MPRARPARPTIDLVRFGVLALAWVASTAIACSQKAEPAMPKAPATSACSPLADPNVHIDDEAVTPDGHYVVLIGSGDLPSRLFYGTPDHMTEGRITDTAAGCFRSYSFVVDGASYTATLGYAVCNGNIRSRLSHGDSDLVGEPLTLLLGPGGSPNDGGAGAPAAPVMGLTFFCF